MPETADTELQFPANFLKSFEISIQRRQNFSISCNNLVKLAMSFSTHLDQDVVQKKLPLLARLQKAVLNHQIVSQMFLQCC